jgi:hypothetical protein
MILRISRFILITAGVAALFLFGTNQELLSTKPVQLEKHLLSAKDLEISCSGPAVIAGGASGTSVTDFKRVGKAGTSISYSGLSSTELDGYSTLPIKGYSIRQDLSKLIGKPSRFTVVDQTGKAHQGSKLLSANQLQLADNKKIRGLLAAPCLRPQSEFWLVGGSTAVGREALLILNNPTAIDSTVDLHIFTENGSSNSAGLSGISVPANKTTFIPLSSFVLRADSIAVQVLSKGGAITALIQQKTVRGTSASGADYISPSPAANVNSVFPGILVRGSKDSAKFRAKDDKYSDVQQMLRVFVPGKKNAKINLQVLGTNAKTFGTVLSLNASAGKVSDFKITGLADGDYFGILSSDVEVFSSIRLVRSKGLPGAYTDFAWINPAEGFNNERYIAVPKAGISKLSITNPSAKPTTVMLKIGSVEVSRTVSSGSTEVIKASSGLSIGIIPTGETVYANLVIDVSGRVSVLPVLDDKNISGEVEVSVH